MADDGMKNGNLFGEPTEDECRTVEEKQKRSLANLKPFKPGQSGNPRGRKPGGLYVQEFLNMFLAFDDSGKPAYSHRDLEVIVSSKDQPPAAKVAARRILSASRDPRKYCVDKKGRAHHAGTDPEPGKDFDRIMDRLVGKPVTTVEADVTHNHNLSTDDLEARLMALLRSNPELLNLLLQRLGEPDLARLADPSRPALPDVDQNGG